MSEQAKRIVARYKLALRYKQKGTALRKRKKQYRKNKAKSKRQSTQWRKKNPSKVKRYQVKRKRNPNKHRLRKRASVFKVNMPVWMLQEDQPAELISFDGESATLLRDGQPSEMDTLDLLDQVAFLDLGDEESIFQCLDDELGVDESDEFDYD